MSEKENAFPSVVADQEGSNVVTCKIYPVSSVVKGFRLWDARNARVSLLVNIRKVASHEAKGGVS